MNKGIKGTKEIPFKSIIAVQFKEAGAIFNGYLQFTIPGGNESKGGIFAATKDEHTFMFTRANNAQAMKSKEYIDSIIHRLQPPQSAEPTLSLSDELQKLAQLRDQGVLSEAEFQSAKKKVMS